MAEKENTGEGVTIEQMREGLKQPVIKNLFSRKVITETTINPHAVMLRLFVDITRKKPGAKSAENELSPRAKQIFAFAINCCTCETGGTDATTEFFTAISTQLDDEGINFEELKKEHQRIRGLIQNCLLELKLNATRGEGNLVCYLLDQEPKKIVEPPHQEQHLMNMIGAHIGAKPEKSIPPFDRHIRWTNKKLQELSVQKCLDAFYQVVFTPEILVNKISRLLNKKILTLWRDDDKSLYNATTEALGANIGKYVIFDDKWQFKELNEDGVIALLVNLGYFQKVESH